MTSNTFLVGEIVQHTTFGEGTVISLENSYINIEFRNGNSKKFRYPDAFESFLSIANQEIERQIEADLEKRRTETDYTEHKKSHDMYQHMKELEKRRSAQHEYKQKIQMEKQWQSQMMRKQKMQQYEKKENKN